MNNPVRSVPFDVAQLKALADAVVTHDNPEWHLFDVLLDCEKTQNPHLAVAVFESVQCKRPVHNFWVYSAIAPAYSTIGEDSSAFLCAARAMQIEPTGPSGPMLNELMFKYLFRRGRVHDAVDLFLSCLQRFPGAPIASPEDAKVAFAAAGVSLGASNAKASAPLRRHVHRVFDQEKRAPWACPSVFGGALPKALQDLTHPSDRPAIDVVLLEDAELLVADSQLVILGSDHCIQRDVSVCRFPDLMDQQLTALENQPDGVERLTLDDAAVILDNWPGPNYCHFLYDYVTRLALYEAVGVNVSDVTILGPELHAPFQRALIEAFGVKKYLSLQRRARIKVNKLWVSTNCADARHHAHYGASWCHAFIRKNFNLNIPRGTRRLYVSRSDGQSRRVKNEDEVLALLGKYGFDAIVPGRMSVNEQVEAFREASHVVGPHGAAMANIVFAPPGLHLLEIFHPLYCNTAFAAQAPALQIHYAAMIAQDWQSDAPEFTNPDKAKQSLSNFWHSRDMYVEPSQLLLWLNQSGSLT